jgi:hypothetical protein
MIHAKSAKKGTTTPQQGQAAMKARSDKYGKTKQ